MEQNREPRNKPNRYDKLIFNRDAKNKGFAYGVCIILWITTLFLLADVSRDCEKTSVRVSDAGGGTIRFPQSG